MRRFRELAGNLDLLPAFAHERDMVPLIEAHVHNGVPIEQARQFAEWGVWPVAGAGTDTGEALVQNAPIGVQVRRDSDAFFRLTKRTFYRIATRAWSADAELAPIELPKVGVISKVIVRFRAQLQQTVGAGTTRQPWPYGILNRVEFTANGQDKVQLAQGLAFKALERTRYTGNFAVENGDRIGADLGIGDGINVAVANHELDLTWEVPFTMDESSLFGALFAQSHALALELRLRTAPIARIIQGGTTAFAAGAEFEVFVESFEVPVAGNAIILPETIDFLRGFNETVYPFSNTGDVRSSITRNNGHLQRIFVQAVQDRADPQDFYDPRNDAEIDEFRLEVGANDQPYVYRRGSALVARNARDYGNRLPYRFVCFDFARYNSIRDALNLGALTELYVVTTIDSGAAPVNGDHRIVVETLYR